MDKFAFLITAASIVGTCANSFQKKWCFYVWMVTNTFWCVYNFIAGQHAQAILYVFNFVMCVVGLRKWKKGEKESGAKNRDCL